MTTVEQIKDAVDIAALIEETYQISNGNGRYRRAREHDSLVIDTHKQVYHWYSKDEHGDAIDWVGRYCLTYSSNWSSSDGAMFKEALTWLADHTGLPAPQFKPEDVEVRAKRQNEKQLMKLALDHYQENMPGSLAEGYALGRGFSEETIATFRLGFSTGSLWRTIQEEDRQQAADLGLIYLTESRQWRDAIPAGNLVYPHLIRNQVTYFAGRHVSEKRHWNQRSEKRMFWALQNFSGPLVICEGQADAISLHQLGVNALALCGVNLSSLDIDMMTFFDAIYYWADRDVTGQDSVERVAEAVGPLLRMVRPWQGYCLASMRMLKDANDYLKAGARSGQIHDMMVEARPYLDRLIEQAKTARGAEVDESLEVLFSNLVKLDRAEHQITLTRYRSQICKQLNMSQADFGRFFRASRGISLDDQEAEFARGGQYTEIDGWTVIKQTTDNGSPRTIWLANFTARIAEMIRYDDGSNEADNYLVITGESANGQKFPTVTIPTTEFAGLTWVLKHWGVEAIISPGKAAQDHLRAAIQFLSGSPQQRHTFTHTGWREINGAKVFLSSAGALGAQKDSCIDVDLKLGRSETNMIRYSLPMEPGDLRAAVESSLKFWHIAPYEMTIPIWAAMYLAPLNPFLSADFGLWIHGKSGSMKSSLVGCALAHFGDWTGRSAKDVLPSNFISTANSILMNAFQAKDVPLVIDDFAPGNTIREQRERDEIASRLLRSMGNKASRQRMRDGRRFQNDYPPRCLAIITAEDLPTGQSIMARGVGVKVAMPLNGGAERREIEMRLAKAQDSDSHLYQCAMAGFLMWVQRHWDELKVDLPQLVGRHRNELIDGSHARLPDAFGKLLAAIDTALLFAVDVNALTMNQAAEKKQIARQALLQVMQAHGAAVESVDACVMFREVVEEMLDSQQWYLLPAEPGEEVEALPFSSKKVGYYDNNFIYLLTAAAREVIEIYNRQGTPFPVGRNTLYERLAERGWLHRASNGALSGQVYISRVNTSPRVLKLRKESIFNEN